jgi:hypothetical protein
MRAVLAGLVIILGTAAWVGTPVAATAQPSCYTGCTRPSVPPGEPPIQSGGHLTGSSTPGEPQGPASSSGGLPFTGSDIAELSVLGLIVLAAGGILAYRGRRTTRQPG